MVKFRDRGEAGKKLSVELEEYKSENPIVLSLLRGGVPVGFEIAKALSAQLDIWVVRKIGVPWQPEYGVGAAAEGGYVYLATHDTLEQVGLSDKDLSEIVASKRREVEERVLMFRGNNPRPDLKNRTVIIVDDGIATGGTVRAAARSVRNEEPAKVILAVPVAALDAVRALAPEVDRIISILIPTDLYAIGLWYEDFEQVSDENVKRLLEIARGDEPERQ